MSGAQNVGLSKYMAYIFSRGTQIMRSTEKGYGGSNERRTVVHRKRYPRWFDRYYVCRSARLTAHAAAYLFPSQSLCRMRPTLYRFRFPYHMYSSRNCKKYETSTGITVNDCKNGPEYSFLITQCTEVVDYGTRKVKNKSSGPFYW